MGVDNGLSLGRCQPIIWTNAGILLIGPLGTNFSGILIEVHIFSFWETHFKMPSVKWRPFCPGLHVIMKVVHAEFLSIREHGNAFAYQIILHSEMTLGLCSLNGKTSYRKISWSLEAARFEFKLFQSLWNLAGTSAAACQISERYDHWNIQSLGFETSRDLAVRRLTA